MKSFKRAKRHKDRIASKSTTIEQSYYKLFVLYSIILLVGIFLPQYLRVYYLEYSFMYIVVIPISFICGLYFKCIKKLKKGLLYISLWGTFCITFSLYSIVNIAYMNSQDTHSFMSEIENVESSAYRSPPFISFKLDNEEIALIINNEYPIKEKIEREKTLLISGQYKKGLFSSIMIVDYSVY